MYHFVKYTEFSTSNRSDWTYEEKCRYGSECDYELSLKLDKIADE